MKVQKFIFAVKLISNSNIVEKTGSGKDSNPTIYGAKSPTLPSGQAESNGLIVKQVQ